MKKNLTVMLLSVAFLFSGCSGNTGEIKAAEITTEFLETSEISEKAEPLTQLELDMGVTEEGKKSFLEKYSEEDYEVAMASVPVYLQLHTNAQSPIKEADIEKYRENYIIETVELTSTLDGHIIPADYIINGDKDRDTVITVHGSGENRRIKEIEIFLEMGYNVIAYDMRSSGDNAAKLATFGILEHYDLIDYINYAHEQISADKKLVVYGKSQGGASVGMALGSDDANQKVDYAILDCPVGSMKAMIDQGIGRYCKSDEVDYVYQCGNEFMQHFYRFDINDGEVSKYVKSTEIPILIFTSKKDTIVPLEQPQSIYDAIPHNNKYIYISEKAGHCGIYYDEYEEYYRLVEDILNGSLFN